MVSSPAGSVPLVADGSDQLEVPKRAIYLVYLIVFMDSIGTSISTPVMPYYAKSFGVGADGVGYLFAAWSLTAAIFPPILGGLADRIGRRPVLTMSLFGAGIAGLGQALAPNYYVFLLARAFSGVWGAVGSTAQVYISDVAPPSIRIGYLTTLSALFPLAVIIGPGIGGLLSEVSPNFPILLDGSITIATAIFVALFLVETPAFLRSRADRLRSARAEASEPQSSPTPPPLQVPLAVHALGVSTFCFGVMFGTHVSMYAIFMQDKFGTGPLHIGFVFMAGAVVMMATNLLLVKRLQRWLGQYRTGALGTLVFGALLVIMAEVESEALSIIVFILSMVGTAFRMATNPSMVAEMTSGPEHRGKVFGLIQRYNNLGRFVGPVVMGHVSNVRSDLPFVGCFLMSLLSVATLLTAERLPKLVPPAVDAPCASLSLEVVVKRGDRE
ncbi:unnamed protein product [Polarella glacialis]|uniref:Major facilitator superfamily (MFS) profile domain-containing protein n=1 Tax=Polarella glacialis TaxID=89957 RepID=A0A813GVF2_POLGL|nr:unnamed protein product [Polarella glacialis]